MALLLETTLGDLLIELDLEGSPEICKNVLKLAKARYYTSTLVYNVQPNRFCQLGDPQGDGSGGACIHGLISSLLSSDDGKLDNRKVLQSQQRFLKSNMGRPLTDEECQEKGRVVATEMKGIRDTIGSQLLITTCSGNDMALDGYRARSVANSDETQFFRSVGVVKEDQNNVLGQIATTYCDADGRPYADIRVLRALVVDDPFEDPPDMDQLLTANNVVCDNRDHVVASPEYERPPEENIEIRIQADQVDPLNGEEDLEQMREQEEDLLKREDKSRAVVLEMLGDLPDAEATAPENVLFVCKLNPVTEDEDLELIFSRFDEKVKAEIIRDADSGSSLQYAFVEFSTKEQAVEAYFKMNNALVDDRRIKVDFSQSVSKVWNKFSQRMRNSAGKRSNQNMPNNPFSDGNGRHAGRNNTRSADHIRGPQAFRGNHGGTHRDNSRQKRGDGHGGLDNRRSKIAGNNRGEEFDQFGRRHPRGDLPPGHDIDRNKEKNRSHHGRHPQYNKEELHRHEGRRRRHESGDCKLKQRYDRSGSRSRDRSDRRERDERESRREKDHDRGSHHARNRERKNNKSDVDHGSIDSRAERRERKRERHHDSGRKRHRHDSDDDSSHRNRDRKRHDQSRGRDDREKTHKKRRSGDQEEHRSHDKKERRTHERRDP